jgi:hypothetical protein
VSAIVVQTSCLLVHVRSFTIFINRCVLFASENKVFCKVVFHDSCWVTWCTLSPSFVKGLTEQLFRNSYYGVTKLHIVVSQIH